MKSELVIASKLAFFEKLSMIFLGTPKIYSWFGKFPRLLFQGVDYRDQENHALYSMVNLTPGSKLLLKVS